MRGSGPACGYGLFSGCKEKFAWSVMEEERGCGQRNWEGKVHAMLLTEFLK